MPDERTVLRAAESIIRNHQCCRGCGQRALGEFMQALGPYLEPRLEAAFQTALDRAYEGQPR